MGQDCGNAETTAASQNVSPLMSHPYHQDSKILSIGTSKKVSEFQDSRETPQQTVVEPNKEFSYLFVSGAMHLTARKFEHSHIKPCAAQLAFNKTETTASLPYGASQPSSFAAATHMRSLVIWHDALFVSKSE